MFLLTVINRCDEASLCGPGTCWQGAEPNTYLCVCPEEWTGTNCDEVAGKQKKGIYEEGFLLFFRHVR